MHAKIQSFSQTSLTTYVHILNYVSNILTRINSRCITKLLFTNVSNSEVRNPFSFESWKVVTPLYLPAFPQTFVSNATLLTKFLDEMHKKDQKTASSITRIFILNCSDRTVSFLQISIRRQTKVCTSVRPKIETSVLAILRNSDIYPFCFWVDILVFRSKHIILAWSYTSSYNVCFKLVELWTVSVEEIFWGPWIQLEVQIYWETSTASEAPTYLEGNLIVLEAATFSDQLIMYQDITNEDMIP